MDGFADLHNHQFSYLGFGGRAFHGRAFGDIEQALPWCDFVRPAGPFPEPIHSSGGVGDLVGNIMAGTFGHLVGGYPQFDGWPRWNSMTHQAVYEDWLYRALQGGLRLMVMLAVNNEFLCEKVNRVLSCNDMEAALRQIMAARQMEAYIDQRNGGVGKGWYRIVHSPQQARAVMGEGKLAVVLGIEVDYLFNARPGAVLTAQDVIRELDRYYRLGVRHVFPIHFGDNLFGGTAFQNQLQHDLNFPMRPLMAAYDVNTEDGKPWGYEMRGGRRNVRGLTDLGKLLVMEMMNRGMIIDIDHMSARSKADTFDLAETRHYPLVSGHTGFVEICRGEKRHEGQLLPEEVERIANLGGMVSVIVNQGSTDEIITWNGPDQHVVNHTCGHTSESLAQAYLYATHKTSGGPVGLGTDFNGFAGLPGPRFGADRCPGGTEGEEPDNPTRVGYPYRAIASNTTMDRSVVGRKTFDINVDGLAHVGLLPDLVADLQALGLSRADLSPLLASAEGYATLWQKAWSARPGREDISPWVGLLS